MLAACPLDTVPRLQAEPILSMYSKISAGRNDSHHMVPGEETREKSYWYQVQVPGAMSAKMLSPL